MTLPISRLSLQTPQDAARWLQERVRGALRVDSRSVTAGDGFIAWPGAATDGRRHVAAALAQGAVACLVEHEDVDAFGFDAADERIATYVGLKAATGPIAAAYYAEPSGQFDVLAVTGTNGKTSTAWWLAEALNTLPHVDGMTSTPCAVIGTLGVGVPPELVYTGLTTPDPVTLQCALRGFADRGFGACAIEASSIGIAERRLDGLRIAVAVFTNFTQDHLDYHGSMDAYWEAKAELFRWPGLRAAVVNIDDVHGAALVAGLLETATGALDVWTVSASATTARLTAREIGYDARGLGFTVCEHSPDGDTVERLDTSMVGEYNVANLLGVIGALRALGLGLTQAVDACRGLGSVPGRMERVDVPGKPLAIIDYAHTPDALDKALTGLRPLAEQRGGALWCVFGCGGDRDAIKRPMMAAIAETLAQAAPQDIVLIAGKGHESWQEISGERFEFSDRLHAAVALGAPVPRSAP